MAIEPHNNSKIFQELLDKLKEQGNNSNHENLQGLLGGNASGHFHLTKEQLQLIDNISSGGSNHENLTGLLGGNSSGHFHLTQDELNKLSAYPAYSSLNHEHLQGLLGGNSSGRYHLTVDLLNKLINLPVGGGSSSSLYRFVRNIFEAQITYSNSNDKGIGSLQNADSFYVPAGVDTIFVSGCGGGGGLFVNGNSSTRNGKGISAGWTAAQCLNVKFNVKEGDSIALYPGRGGANFDALYRTSTGSRGEDSILWINGAEKIRLAGGNRGMSGSNGGNQSAESKINGYASDSSHSLIHASYSQSFSNDFQNFKNIVLSTGLSDADDFCLSFIHSSAAPPSLFGNFGCGSHSLDALSSTGGCRGLFIIEYLERVSS